MSKKRIAVITARADDSEQKAVLDGITDAALSLNCDVAVFTNIYNHWVIDEFLNFCLFFKTGLHACDIIEVTIKIISCFIKTEKRSKVITESFSHRYYYRGIDCLLGRTLIAECGLVFSWHQHRWNPVN